MFWFWLSLALISDRLYRIAYRPPRSGPKLVWRPRGGHATTFHKNNYRERDDRYKPLEAVFRGLDLIVTLSTKTTLLSHEMSKKRCGPPPTLPSTCICADTQHLLSSPTALGTTSTLHAPPAG